MAEEVLEEIYSGDPKPKPGLADEHRAKLDSIVQQMMKNKESDNDIQVVVNDFKQKYSSAQAATEQTPKQQEFKPAVDWLSIPQGYQPMDKNNSVVVDNHAVKTGQASERVKEHLMDIDQSVHNLIYNKKKDLQGRIISEQLGLNPKELGPVNPQAQELESQLKNDIPVGENEIQEFKTGMNENQVMMRQGLAQKAVDLTKSDPAKAKALKSDIYRLDRQSNPEKDEKIDKNIEKINDGEYDYDIVNGKLVKPEGLFGSLVTGVKEKNKAYGDYEVYKSGDEKKMLDLIKRRLTVDPDEAEPVPEKGWASGALSEGARMVGGFPLKPLIGGGVAGWLGGPTAGAAAAAAISAPEMYKLTFGSALPHNYDAIKKQEPNLTDAEALQKAVDLTHDQANVDAASGAAMGALGARVGFKPTGLSSGLLQKSLGSALKQIGQATVKKGMEGLGVGSVGATAQLVKNLMAQKAGIPVDESEGMAQQLWAGVGLTMGMTILAKFPKLLKPKTYNQLLQSLRNVPTEQMVEHINELEKSGVINHEEAQSTQKAVEEHQALDNSIKPEVPEADRIKIQELIKKRNELEGSLETTDKAYHADIKEEIKSLNENILNVSKGSERGELQKLVDQEHKDGNVEGFVTQALRDASEGDLKKYFKEISEQIKGGNEDAAIATFGENIVNKAKELYPPEAPKESSVSVIQPGEIKHPETITIAPKENVVGFKTAKGSEYSLEGNKTIRNKAARPEHPGDSGIKEQSLATVYLSPGEASKADVIYTQGVKSRQINNVGNEIHIVDELDSGKIRTTRIKYSKNPDMGLHPFEVFNDGGAHLGNKITELIKNKENAISVGGPEEAPVVEASGDGQPLGEGVPESEEAANAQEIGLPPEKGTGAGQEGIGEPPTPTSVGGGIHAEHPETQLSFRGLQDTANEFGFEDVRSRDPKTDLQTRVNAERTANEWASKGEYQSNVDAMLDKVEKRQMVPTDEQRFILEQYIENEKQKLRDTPKASPEYDVQLGKVKHLVDIGNTARSEAGAALRLPGAGSRAHPITDEANAMVAKMEANGVDKLTDQQKAEVEAQVEKYKQASEEADRKTAALEEQVAKMEAQKEFNKTKSTTKRTKKTTEERAAFRRTEIEAARAALKKLRTGESGLSAVPLPGVRELMAIAPHVKNIMVDLVAQGVDNLQDVISHLHAEFKDVLDGVTEKNIHDIIAGEYNEKGKSITELQRQVMDLRDEAKLINQVEALENGVAPKSERAKVERNQKIKELRAKIKELKATDGADELLAIKKRNEQLTKKIKDKIANGQFEKETKKSIFDREDVKKNYPGLRKEALEAIVKKEDAQHEFDLALFNDEMKQRKWYQKAGSFGAKLIHTSKAVMSGIDDSATFVQNGLVVWGNPKIGAKAWINHWKDAFSDARFKRELAALHARPDWEIIKNSGLEIVEPHSAASKQVEEAFEQNLLAGKFKIGDKEYQPWKNTGGIFERAFTSMGNNMRLLLFEKRMAELEDSKMTFESHPQEYKDAARVINELSGRGKLPAGLAQASPYITPFIWAPRMLTSTLNTLGIGEAAALIPGRKGYYQSLTPMQRKFALSQLGRGVGMGAAVMAAAALGGAKVDSDPRSVTFGDVIIGDHHYNVFGRYTPVIKTLVQFSTGKRIKGGGEEQDLDSGKFGAKTRLGVVGGFFRGKATPALGTAMNLAEGRNYFTNEEFTVKDLPEALLQPMSIKELRQGWEHDGTATILNRFLPAFEGMKTSDERDFEDKAEAVSSASKKKSVNHTRPHVSHKTH